MTTIDQTHTLRKEAGLTATYSIVRKDTGKAVGSVTRVGNRFWRATYNGAESVGDTRWQAVGRAHKQARRATYIVTVRVEGREPVTYEVDAPDEWKARTRAIARYTDTHNLSGEFVDYDVREKNA